MEQRRRGRPYREILPRGDQPLIVKLLRENLSHLTTAFSDLQHAEAMALHAEGMTMEQIGQLFGISHQRVSAMLKRGRDRAAIAGGESAGLRRGRSADQQGRP